MIFKKELIPLILNGKKTQTRRLVKNDKPRWKVGNTYAVQDGRGRPAICRIKILSIKKEKLLDIDEKDAKREGCYNRVSFLYTFYYLNKLVKNYIHLIGHPDSFAGKKWNPDVWILDFELVKK